MPTSGAGWAPCALSARLRTTPTDCSCIGSSGSRTAVDTVRTIVEETRERTGQTPVVVVDYLQKIHASGPTSTDERIAVVVEALKDLALEMGLPILAVVASDKAGLTSGKRMRVEHLRGSSALAYEPDVVLIINDKYDVVARHHLMYDLAGAERFRRGRYSA